MKKLLSGLFVALFALFTMVGCSSVGKCTLQYVEAEKVELVSYDDGMKSITTDGNKVIVEISEEGTYEIQVKVDGEDDTIEVTRTKDGYEGKTVSGQSFMVGVE